MSGKASRVRAFRSSAVGRGASVLSNAVRERRGCRRDARSVGAWGGTGGLGWGGAALGRLAQGEVYFEADGVLDAQDPEDAGLGQREVREREGGPGLDPGRRNGRANACMFLGA